MIVLSVVGYGLFFRSVCGLFVGCSLNAAMNRSGDNLYAPSPTLNHQSNIVRQMHHHHHHHHVRFFADS